MAELVFLKLGGSLITNKRRDAVARPQVIRRLSDEIHRTLEKRPDLRLLIGHGSGSFGHVVARRYHVQEGCTDWMGYAETSAAATRLNRIVTDALLEAGVPVVSIQPSASARCREGELVSLALDPIRHALEHELVPLTYGDVALDELWGSTIASTEMIFAYMARRLLPQRIILAGDVEGVYAADPVAHPHALLLPRISVLDETDLSGALGGSSGTDVTGGMRTKVRLMIDVVRELPDLQVRVISGLQHGLVERVLAEPQLSVGTLLTS